MAEIRRKAPEKTLSEIAYPSAEIPYLFVSDGGKTTASLGRWGFRLSMDKLVYNARQETVLSKGMFQGCFAQGRCIVPAHGFFEWDTEHRQFLFSPRAQTLLYFAALYRQQGEKTEIIILTTHSKGEIAAVHHRMPLILEENQLRPWLYDTQAAKELLSQVSFPLQGKLTEE